MKEARFRTTIALSLAALIVQFLLGTAVNLFVKIPTNHPGSNPPEYFGGAAAVGSRWRPSVSSACSAPASMAVAFSTITKTSARC